MSAVVRFWRKGYEDNLTGMAAMVAYTLMLSVFPLALVGLFLAGRILASEEIERSVVVDLQRLFPSAAESTLLDGLRRVRESSTTVGIVAVIAAVWFSSTFWGALDTAFCRIYHRECRSWVRQKVFASASATPSCARWARRHPPCAPRWPSTALATCASS